ncbi:MAG TPA: fasciclin domain-containing protein [Bacteroidales bacterium]|nr:fasciclin domain-containing protein [Bacteroidales bacterium]
MKRQDTHITLILILLAAAAVSLIINCQQEEPLEVFFEEDELLISAYLEEHADEYSTLIRVLEITNLKSTLNAYGHYTFFAPGNHAFDDFCAHFGKGSVEEFDTDYLANLVRYHLINVETESAYFRNGAFQDTTYSGDYLVITFSEGGLETIHVNDALITERDIQVGNGFIHKIDKVLTPIVGSVMDFLKESGDYSIFSNALELSGLADSLHIIMIELNEDIVVRSRFTLFAEPDEVYNQEGIFNAEDLVTRYSDTGDPTGKEDGFYQFMAYHIMPGLYYLNAIDSFNYPTLAENMLINVHLRDKIYLNRHMEIVEGQSVEKFITVNDHISNRQAKNGVIHSIDRIMEPFVPSPVYMIIDFTDYQGISLGKIYTEKDLQDIRGILVKNTGMYFRNSILGDGETNLQTTSNKVGWTVEFELPPILRGQYDVYLHWASHQDHCWWAQAFWDGARLGNPFSFVHSKRWPGVEWKYDYNTSQWMGRLLLNETSSHTIKFIALEGGYGNFDYIVLWPVEN